MTDVKPTEPPIDRLREARIDRAVARFGEQMARAKEYTNFIIVAGYAAFFALWSGIAADLTVPVRAAAVVLMGLSLVLFVGWEVASMIIRERSDRPFTELSAADWSADDFDDRWTAAQARSVRINAKLMLFWPWVVGPSVVLGLAGAAAVIGSAFAKAFST